MNDRSLSIAAAGLSRRTLLERAAVLAALSMTPGFTRTAFAAAEADYDAAFNYLYPLFEFARAESRAGLRAEPDRPLAERLNRFFHRRELTNASARQVTAPNNDTVYSSAFLELSGGPVELTIPTERARYFSVAFMNAFTDNFHYVGSRATGGVGGRFWVVGPGYEGAPPSDVTLIRSETNDVWAVVRILAGNPDDLAAANRFQDQIAITLPEGRGPTIGPAATAEAGTDPGQLLAAANEMLGRSQPLQGQALRAARFAALGVQPGETDAFARMDAAMQEAWRAAAARGLQRLRLAFGREIIGPTGWGAAPPETGDFGENDLARAAIALGGLAALGREEAIYFTSVNDADGAPLDPARDYLLRVPAVVPAQAFWSVTMYAADLDGRFFLFDNPIKRYSIGDRTPDLARNAEGGLEIILSRKPPGSSAGNWLPRPDGPFRVSFRLYVPTAEALEGRWTPPPLTPIGEAAR